MVCVCCVELICFNLVIALPLFLTQVFCGLKDLCFLYQFLFLHNGTKSREAGKCLVISLWMMFGMELSFASGINQSGIFYGLGWETYLLCNVNLICFNLPCDLSAQYWQQSEANFHQKMKDVQTNEIFYSWSGSDCLTLFS